jgi:hypothetical protein
MKLQDTADVELVLNGILPKIAVNGPTLERHLSLLFKRSEKAQNSS